MSIRLYKDGDQMAIETDCEKEETFIEGMSLLLEDLIDKDEFIGDWEFQFRFWLPCIVDLCCAYRGYKNDVEIRKSLLAGRVHPDKLEPRAMIDNRGRVFYSSVDESEEAENETDPNTDAEISPS